MKAEKVILFIESYQLLTKINCGFPENLSDWYCYLDRKIKLLNATKPIGKDKGVLTKLKF